MRHAPANAMVFGHPIVTTPLVVLCLMGIGLFVYDNSCWLYAAVLLPLTVKVTTLSDERRKYLARKSEWESYTQPVGQSEPEPIARPVRHAGIKHPVLGGFLLLLLAGFFVVQADDPVYLGALIWLTGSAVVIAVCLWIVRLRRNARGSGKICVQVCVARPLMSVPSIRGAYRALPDHCRGLLAGQSRATFG